MNKIIFLVSVMSFVKADAFDSSFAGNVLQGAFFNSGLGSVLSKYSHTGLELIGGIGGMVDDKNPIVKEGQKNPYMKSSVGLMLRSALGTNNLQIGIDLGLAAFKDYSSFKLGAHLYARYSEVFARLGGGISVYSLGSQVLGAYHTYLQLGYNFYESFYISAILEYNFGSTKAEEEEIRTGISQPRSVSRREKVSVNGFAFYIGLGVFDSVSNSNIKSMVDEEEAREIAKLRARDRYAAEKAKSEELKKSDKKVNDKI